MSDEKVDLFQRDCGVVKELYREWQGDVIVFYKDYVQVSNDMFIELAINCAIKGIEYNGTLHLELEKDGIKYITVINKKG